MPGWKEVEVYKSAKLPNLGADQGMFNRQSVDSIKQINNQIRILQNRLRELDDRKLETFKYITGNLNNDRSVPNYNGEIAFKSPNNTIDTKINSNVVNLMVKNVLRTNGSEPLTQDWNAGLYKITANQFESVVATGTPPFVVASTTVVSNLNSDTVDGYHHDQSLLQTASPQFEKVGAGIAPTYKFHASSDSVDGTTMLLANTTAAGIGQCFFSQCGSNGYGAPGWPSTFVMEGSSSGGFLISAFAGPIRFQTNSRTTRMQITSGGHLVTEATSYIGIGGTPSYPLDITSNSVDTTAFRVSNTTAGGTFKNGFFAQCGSTAFGISDWVSTFILEGQANGGIVLGAYASAGSIKFQTNGRNTRMVLDSNGDLTMKNALKHLFRDTAIGIYSQADTFLDIFADGAVRIGDSSAGAPTNYVNINSTGDISFNGSAGLYPRTLSQADVPGAGTGVTQLDTGEICMWIDTDDSKCYLCYNQSGTVKKVELT